MKPLTYLIIIFLLSGQFCHGQDANEISRQKVKLEIDKAEQWQSLDRHLKPVTDEQVNAFFDYIKKSPIIEHFETDDDVAINKIRAAQNLYKNINDESQKNKIIDLLKNTFKEIQVVRDTLGINPYSETEGYLYVNPTLGPKDPEHTEGETTLSSPRFHEVLDKKNQARMKIENLEQIHGYLYDLMTQEMKIQLPGIVPRLERSPEEKARTKDMLEAQAAALGRKKPDPKEPENEGK